eukprot:Em0003g1595a
MLFLLSEYYFIEKFHPNGEAIPPADPPQSGANPQQLGEAIPPKEGAEFQGGVYLPQGGAYPPQGGAYPLQGGAYPPQGGAYPPQGGAYLPQGGAYPPQGGAYPPQGGAYLSAYPPQGGAYLPQGGAYPPQGGAYLSQGGAYPQQGGAYPPQGGAYLTQGGAYSPQQGGAYPSQQGGVYPPQQGGVYPPQQGGVYPPQQGGAYPPQQGGVQPGFNGSPPYYPQAIPQQQTNVVIVQPKSTAPVYTPVGDYGYTISIVLTVICFLCGSWWSLCCTIPAIFVASSVSPTTPQVSKNGRDLRSQFGGSIALSSHSDTKSFHLLMGICYEHRQNAVGCLKLDSMDAIRDVHTKVAADECHVASEALIVMAQPYDNINYLPIPLIIIPSCKNQGRLGELLNSDSGWAATTQAVISAHLLINFNLAEANFNLSTAHQISLILEEHPEWSRGHRLLKATEDKVNPLSWRVHPGQKLTKKEVLTYPLRKEEYIGVLGKKYAAKDQERRLTMDLTKLKNDVASVTKPLLFWSKARNAAMRGDLEGARRNGRIAYGLNIAAVIFCVIIFAAIIITGVSVSVQSSRRYSCSSSYSYSCYG